MTAWKALAVLTAGSLACVCSAQARPIQSARNGLDAILSEFRQDPETAVREFAEWPDDRLLREGAAPPRANDVYDVAALILLHLQAGISKGSFGELDRSSVGLEKREPHYRLSYPLVVSLLREAATSRNRSLFDFCRNWWIVGTSTQIARSKAYNLSVDPDFTREFPEILDHPDAYLLKGTIAEHGMGPEVFDGPFAFDLQFFDQGRPATLVSTPHGRMNANFARDAEVAFRRALQLNPDLNEARLRLGRVKYLMNLKREAESNLSAAVQGALSATGSLQESDRFTAYVGRLFLGRLAEDEGRLPDAIEYYRSAAELRPDAWIGRLSWGQVLLRAGADSEGWAITRQIFGNAEGREDPAAEYPFALNHQTVDRLAAMRAVISRDLGPPVYREAPSIGQPDRPQVSDFALKVQAPSTSSFRSTADGVRIEVLVRDGGRPVKDLSASDFEVIDRGVRQKVDSASAVLGVGAVALIDVSQSTNSYLWPSVIRGAQAFISALDAGDDMAVVTFSDGVARVKAPTTDRSSLNKVLAGLRPRAQSSTSLWDALLASASLAVQREKWPLLALVSDGMDNASWFDRREVIDRLRKLGVIVDAVQVPLERHRPIFEPALGNFSLDQIRELGGLVLSANDQSLSTRLTDHLRDLRAGYILTYRPIAPDQSPGWHDIKVRLKNGKKGNVTARPGYYAKTAIPMRPGSQN